MNPTSPSPPTGARLHGDAFAGARVLVTGGAGFIGSHLAEALDALGADVIVLDDLTGGNPENLAGIRRVTFVEGSILDRDLLARVTRRLPLRVPPGGPRLGPRAASSGRACTTT